MVKLYDKGAYLVNGTKIVEEEAQAEALTGKKVCKDEARKGTIAYGIGMLPSYRTMKYKSPIWGYFHVQKE